MDQGTAKIVKTLFTALGVVWMAGMGWMQFGTLTENDVLTPHSQAVRDRMDNECAGSFQLRYDCKETIVISTVRNSLLNMTMRIGIVVSVPVLLALGFQSLNRPNRTPKPGSSRLPHMTARTTPTRTNTAYTPAPEPVIEEEPVEDDDMSWKKAAKRHISQGLPPQDPPT